jgi:hypothetical protein
VIGALLTASAYVAYARLCRWVRLRRPGSLADRVRAAIACEE